jgi:hypothetical protein
VRHVCNVIHAAHDMKLLTDNPDQRDLWWNDWDAHWKTAVDVIVRMAIPEIPFSHTATAVASRPCASSASPTTCRAPSSTA